MRRLLLISLLFGVSLSAQTISTFACSGTQGFGGDGGAASAAQCNWPSQIVLDANKNVYFADNVNNRIRVINTQLTTQTLLNVSVCSGCIQTVAGSSATPGYSGDGGQAVSAQLGHPAGLAIDSSGNIYIADQQTQRIREVATTGIITTVAGGGSGGTTVQGCGTLPYGGFAGDGGAATSALLRCPQGVAVDSAGNIYLSDDNNYRVRAVNTQGTTQTLLGVSICAGCIQTVLGQGSNLCTLPTYAGNTVGLAVDGSGDLFISRYSCSDIVEITAAGTKSAVAGTTGSSGYSGDGAAATSALLNHPYDVQVDGSGNLYITDTVNNVIRYVSKSSGNISTIAGDYAMYGTGGGFGGDGGAPTSAGLHTPIGIVVDSAGNYWIGDLQNNRVRKVSQPIAGLTLTITLAGACSGVVTSSDGNINCGSSCTDTLTQGNQIILTATPSTGCVFGAFSGGGCTSSPCTYTQGAGNTMVTATFNNVVPNLSHVGYQSHVGRMSEQ